MSSAPVRIVDRAVGDYGLRAVDRLVEEFGGATRGVIALEVARANGAHVDALLFDALAPMPEAARRPVTVSAIARRLTVPHETVRRHLLALEAAGHLRRVEGGVIIAADRLGEAGRRSAVEAYARDLRRLFETLGGLGVLRWWEEAGAAEG